MRLIGYTALPVVLSMVLFSSGCSTDSYSVRTYRMGDTVQLGHLVYNVYDSQWHTHLGEGPAARIPENRFFLVRVSVSNSGNSEIMVPAMTVSDEDGNTYEELAEGAQVPQWLGLLRSVRPGETKQGNIVFDCSPRNYKLRVADESEQRTALVEIPLTFTSETPEIPTPELPERK